MSKVKVQWSFLYENETTEEIEYEDGDSMTDLLSHLAPNELGECVDAWITYVEDDEGNVLYES